MSSEALFPRDLAVRKFVERTVRRDVRDMSAYSVQSASGMLKLDAMESPFTLPGPVLEAMARRLKDVALNRYPPPEAPGLQAALRKYFAIPDELGLCLGNGSDELIGLLIQAVASEKAVVLAPVPTFVMYEAYSRIARVRFVGVPLTSDFKLDQQALLSAIDTHRPALTFIAYPNNPTGTLFDPETIRKVLGRSDGLVVIDEAYQAFAGDSWMNECLSYPNLVVLRTVSKSGLAGVRLGYAIGPRPWIDELQKVWPPYNVNVLTQVVVEQVLAHGDVLQQWASTLRAERAVLAERLAALPDIEVFPSAANFLLFRCNGKPNCANDVFRALHEQQVLIKDVSRAHPLLDNCLRVTVSTRQENEAFLAALTTALTRLD